MRFKHLEVQGYKSFANKTEFVFNDGVTAIIGPNGSGKSNISDGVRWVLGEQSFNLLRGKKTEDMIFSGSDQRARLGMAQVSLTLDNSDGSLPLDFAEVVIARRAYRSGENEYLLNGNRVRLKDIAELLGRSGLGRRTYTVIGQGLVDQVLSLRPEERRSLFEEAAGITVHQAKRDEALRRLDDTQGNLQRVQDIIQELVPRLRHLKQAAERATQAAQLQEDLTAHLRVWYGYRWHIMLEETRRAAEAEQQAAAAQAEQQAALDRLEAELLAQRAQQAALRQRLVEWHTASGSLQREAETLQRNLAVHEERRRLLAAQQEETRGELALLREQESTAERRVLDIQAEQAVRGDALSVQVATVSAAEGAVAASRAARAERRLELEQTQTRVAHLTAEQQTRQTRLAQIDERLATLGREQASRAEQAATARAAAGELAAALAAQEAGLAATTAALERLDASLARQIGLAQQAEREQRKVGAALNEREREAAQLQTRHDMLTRLRQEGAGYASGTRAVLTGMADAQSPLYRRALGTVASLLRVPADLETAVEAALGGQLQDVVVTTWDDAEAAIEHLKRRDGGRATFLPLDTIRPASPLPVPDLPGVIGLGSDLVSVADGSGSLLQYLLNRVVVVEDLPAARRVRGALGRGVLPTFVTPAGDLVRPGGSVSGGSQARNRQEGSMLAREREWRDLPEQLEPVRARCRELEAAVQAADRARQEAEDEQRRLRSARATEQNNDAAGREKAARLQRELDGQNQAARWHTDLGEQAGQEAAGLRATKDRDTRAVAQGRVSQAEARRALEAARAAVAAATSDAVESALAEARAALAATQAQQSAQTALLQQAGNARRRVAEQATAKATRETALADEATRVAGVIEEFDRRYRVLARQIESYQTKVEPAEKELARLESAQMDVESAAGRVRTLLRSAEAQLNQARLNQQRKQDALARLRHDIGQDFGPVLELEQSDIQPDQLPLPLGQLVESFPMTPSLPDGLEAEIQRLRQQLRRLGNVNPEAPAEYQEVSARHAFLVEQTADLEKSAGMLHEVIAELGNVMDREFRKTFRAVTERFKEYFSMLFGGGSARLVLSDPENPSASGIEIAVRPPGKRAQSLALLSGGERALTAAALIFSILSVSPPPFCILDEVDAALDEANIGRFREALLSLAKEIQFIVITHNRGTVEAAGTIYGVSMGADNASQVISLHVDQVTTGSLGSSNGNPAVTGRDVETVDA